MANPQGMQKLSVNNKGVARMQPPKFAQAQAQVQKAAPVQTPVAPQPTEAAPTPMKKGGMTASKRADGCCVRGKTKA